MVLRISGSVVGKRFTVVKPSRMFPRDFEVVSQSERGGILRLKNDLETYDVPRIAFEAEQGVAFRESEA